MLSHPLENYLENVLYIKLKQVKDKQAQADGKVLETENLIRYLSGKLATADEPARYLVDMGAEVFVETEVDGLSDVNVELMHGFYLSLPLQAGIDFLTKRNEIYKERQNQCLELVAKAKTDIKCFLEALGALSDPAVQQMMGADAAI